MEKLARGMRTRELAEKMDSIIKRMNLGEISAEDVVRQLFPVALASFEQASRECSEIEKNLDAIEAELLEAKALTTAFFEFLDKTELLEEFLQFMSEKKLKTN